MMNDNKNEGSESFHSWLSLKTIQTFDGADEIVNSAKNGDDSRTDNNHLLPQLTTKTRKDETFSTNEMQSSNSNQTQDLIKTFTPKAGTPVSLLVESLVQQLCSIIEPNSQRSQIMYEAICEKLHQLHLIDESYQMSEFEVMRSSYQKALYQLVTVTKGDNLPIQLDNIWPLSLEEPMNGLEWSRYYREFEELEYIADGGFGQVHKARHKLDGITYAVKKVCIKSTSIKSVLTHLTEVKTLASLNHINIVPYKSCWLEPLLSNHQKDTINHQNHPSSIEDSFMSSQMDSMNLPSRFDDTEGSFTVDFEYSENEVEEDPIIKTSTTTSSTSSSGKSNSRQLKVLDANSVVPHVKLKWATLFIQMKLCQKTLRQWLDDRNKYSDFREFYKQYPNFCDGDSDDDWHLNASKNIIKQVINGLGYIHSRGIVHHDIKPSNVFICEEYDGSLTVQLGDFGLACPENQRQGQHANLGGYGFGTPLYAAPEQLNGQCDKKSDIYSLGVILVELLVKCVTEMERHDLIEKIKIGKFPQDMDSNFSELIKQLLSHQPRKRPDIQQLHDSINQITTKNIRNEEMDKLKRQLSDREDEIITLKTEFETQSKLKELEIKKKEIQLNLKDAEIDKLKNVILNLQMKIPLE